MADQNTSWSKPAQWQQSGGVELHAARVFFATDQYTLTSDDERALREVARSLVPILLQHGWDISLRCEGWADRRGTTSHNLVLSQKRCKTAIDFLNRELNSGVKDAKYTISDVPCGPGSQPVDLALDRRVDVFVKVAKRLSASPPVTVVQPALRPWAQRRVDLFKKYSPEYQVWRRLGLDHLIEEYEQHEESGRPVRRIRPEDIPKVLALIQQVASPSDSARISRMARSGDAGAVLADAFGVEYRRAYDTAYRRSPGTLIR